MNKRLEYLDIAKGVGAICVLLGHLQGVEIFLLTPYVLPMCQWIFSFHMPLFFIISGMLINHKNDIDKDMGVLVKKRFRGLMIPYFWVSLFQLAVIIAAIVRGASTLKDAGVHIFHIFSFYGIGVMWFLPALFAAELMFIYIMKTQGKTISIWVVSILGVIALYVADYQMDFEYVNDFQRRIQDAAIIITRPFVAMTFIAIGYFGFNLFKEKKNNIVIKRLLGAIAGLALIYIGMVFMPVNMGVDFRSLVLKNEFFYYFCALTNSFGIVLVCKCIGANNILSKIFMFYGTNSLIFMFTHNSDKMLYYSLNLSMWINQFVTRAKGYVSYTVIAVSMLLYTTIMILLINRFAPFIIGKPFKNPFKSSKI